MSEILITWLDRSRSEVGQKIYRATSPIDVSNPGEPYAVLGPDIQEFRDRDFIIGQTYYYRVSSYDNKVERFSEEYVVDTNLPIGGPGPLSFIGGNAEAGYLGEVLDTDLVTTNELNDILATGFNPGYMYSSNWLKFTLDGRILFVSKIPLFRNITWNQLNDSNLINGDREVSIKGYRFKIRLLKGLGPNQEDGPIPGVFRYDITQTWGSEWNRLFYPLIENILAYPKTSQEGPNWESNNWVSNFIYNTSTSYESWCQETIPTNPQLSITRGNNTYVTACKAVSKSNSEIAVGWRPVLELVEAS